MPSIKANDSTESSVINTIPSFQGGNGGRIVNIASLAAFDNTMHFEHMLYCVSKAGMVGYTRHFGECTPVDNPWTVEGVKAYALCPWFVDTALIKGEQRKQIKVSFVLTRAFLKVLSFCLEF